MKAHLTVPHHPLVSRMQGLVVAACGFVVAISLSTGLVLSARQHDHPSIAAGPGQDQRSSIAAWMLSSPIVTGNGTAGITRFTSPIATGNGVYRSSRSEPTSAVEILSSPVITGNGAAGVVPISSPVATGHSVSSDARQRLGGALPAQLLSSPIATGYSVFDTRAELVSHPTAPVAPSSAVATGNSVHRGRPSGAADSSHFAQLWVAGGDLNKHEAPAAAPRR